MECEGAGRSDLRGLVGGDRGDLDLGDCLSERQDQVPPTHGVIGTGVAGIGDPEGIPNGRHHPQAGHLRQPEEVGPSPRLDPDVGLIAEDHHSMAGLDGRLVDRRRLAPDVGHVHTPAVGVVDGGSAARVGNRGGDSGLRADRLPIRQIHQTEQVGQHQPEVLERVAGAERQHEGNEVVTPGQMVVDVVRRRLVHEDSNV